MKRQEQQAEGRRCEVQVGHHQPRCFACSRFCQSTEVFVLRSGSSPPEVPRWSLACEKVVAAESSGHRRRGDGEKEVGGEEEVHGPCLQAARAGPFPASLLGALRGRAVDGRSTCQEEPRGASSIHAVSSRVWVFGVRGGGGEGP